MNKSILFLIPIIVFAMFLIIKPNKTDTKDNWHYSDGSAIVCRVNGCGNEPVYSEWNDRYCKEHLNKSQNHSDEYDSSLASKKINLNKALTPEEADALKGTGYHGTRPNSSAEISELQAAMVKCKKCGMHSDNGRNSLCDECQYNKDYGFD